MRRAVERGSTFPSTVPRPAALPCQKPRLDSESPDNHPLLTGLETVAWGCRAGVPAAKFDSPAELVSPAPAPLILVHHAAGAEWKRQDQWPAPRPRRARRIPACAISFAALPSRSVGR